MAEMRPGPALRRVGARGNPVGRPKLAAGVKKSEALMIRLTPGQMQRVKAAAESVGVKPVVLVRKAIGVYLGRLFNAPRR